MDQQEDNLQDISRHDDDTYSLSVEEASVLFGDAGVPRSPRTIIRYCSQRHLDCIKVDTDRNEKYLVSPKSIEMRIRELQQIRVESQQDKSGYVSTSRDIARREELEELDKEKKELEERLDKLEHEALDLQITNKGKDYLIDQLKSERAQFIDAIESKSHLIGALETKLKQLEAPKSEPGEDGPHKVH